MLAFVTIFENFILPGVVVFFAFFLAYACGVCIKDAAKRAKPKKTRTLKTWTYDGKYGRIRCRLRRKRHNRKGWSYKYT